MRLNLAACAAVVWVAFCQLALAAPSGAELRKLAGQKIDKTDRHWKYVDAFIQWGFKEGTQTLAFDGRIGVTFGRGTLGKVKPAADVPATTIVDDASWKSAASDSDRRGIVVPILYADTAAGDDQTIVTVSTRSGSFSFRPVDLDGGPILANEYGFFVADAARLTNAKDFQKDLAAKVRKTIRQMVRQRPEQTLEDAVKALHGIAALPPIPKPPFEPSMSVEVPCPYMTALWRLGAWQIIKTLPRIDREDVKKVPKARVAAAEIPQHCRIVADPKDPRGLYVVTDNPFVPLGCESDRVIWGLDHQGMHQVTRDGISVWLDNQQKDGCLTIGSWDDSVLHHFGSLNILWVMLDHYRLTGDKAWLKKEMPRLKAGADWIIARRKTTMKEPLSQDEVNRIRAGTWPPYGLQPKIATGDGDGEGSRCYFWNDAFAYRSILFCGKAISEIDPQVGGQLLAEAEAYRKDVLKVVEQAIALSPVIKGRDGTYHSFVPVGFQDHGARSRLAPKGVDVYGHCGIFSSDIVCTSASIEAWLQTGLLSIDDPRIDGHFDVLEDVFLSDNPWLANRTKGYDPQKDWFERAGWGYQSGWERVPDYYLMKDDIPNFLRSVFNRCAADINLTNAKYTFNEHTTFADNDKSFENAIFLSNFRNMLVHENGDALWLAKATPRAWLEHGKKISVKNAPTYFGTLAYEIVSDVNDGRITATIDLPGRSPAKSVIVRFRHPEKFPIKSVTVDGQPWTKFNVDKETVELDGVAGKVTVVASY